MTTTRIRAVRPITAVLAVCTVIGAGCHSAAVGPTGAPSIRSTVDVACRGHPGPNEDMPSLYQRRYAETVAQPLTQIFAVYHAAIESGRAPQIGDAASALYGDIREAMDMSQHQAKFGCYAPEVLARLASATDALASTLAGIVDAAEGGDGKTPADIPALVTQAGPQEQAYIAALNTYAGQFGAQPRPPT